MTRTHDMVADLMDLEPALASGHEIDASLDDLDARIHDLIARYRASNAAASGRLSANGLRIVGAIFSVIGLVTGWGAALAIFGYDGSQPVNVVNIIGFFVVLQLVLVIGTFILALPARVTSGVPLLDGLQHALKGLSPGFIGPYLRRVLPSKMRAALDQSVAAFERHSALFGDVFGAMALFWSQRFALWFQIGALAGAVTLTVFSDLAFGWTTTLDVAASGFHKMTTWLSVPWASVWPGAVPSLELVESTRYFRLSSDPSALGADAARRTQWWPFVLACLLTYALLPRVVTWLTVRWKLNGALNRAIRGFPGVRERAGADRRESVSTRAPQRDEVTNPDLALPPSATLSSVALGATHVFDWGSACGSASACQSLVGHALSIQVLSFNAAGGNRNSADDDAAITGLAERYQAGEAVMVVVRAWETPTMDVLDFLSAIRRVIESKATLCVAILDNQDSAQRGDVKTWQQTIGRLGDPWISTYPVPVTS